MVFPTEVEPRAKRRALSLCQDHLRKVVDVTRKVTQLVDAFVKGDEPSIKRLYDEIRTLGDEVDDAKRTVAQELVSIGAILLNRDDFLRFTDITSEVADLCKGVAFRILEMVEREWDVPLDLRRGMAELAAAVFEAISRLREAVLTLNYGSPNVFEMAKNVEVAERSVDSLYRELEINILRSDLDIATLLLMRDIIQLLEDTADKIEDASDAARILAFAM